MWCIRGSVLDFKILKFRPTSCLVRLFATLTTVLPLAFHLQMLHLAYKTCISFTNRAFEITNCFTIKPYVKAKQIQDIIMITVGAI